MRRLLIGLGVGTTLLLGGCGAPSASDYNNAGTELYDQGLYGQALTQYKEAVLLAPDRPEPNVNLANTRYQLGDYLGAIEAPKDALATTTDPVLQATIYYNQGNAHFRMQEYEQAVEAYKQTLRRTPDDADAKYNLELAQKIIEEQQQQQQQAGGDQPQQPQDGQDPGDQPQPGQGTQPPQPQPGGGQPQDRPAPPPSSLTPGEAERQLDQLRRSEGRRSDDTYDNYAVGGDQGTQEPQQPGSGDDDW